MKVTDVPNIISLMHRTQIEHLCACLPKIANFKYFVSYIVFNNGQTFVLSNMFHMLTAYYVESLYREDFCFRKENTIESTYFLCNQSLAITPYFKDILEQRFGIYRAYYIVRNSPECQFIFGAIRDNPFDNFEWLYKNTLEKFEDFCCDFINGAIDIIKQYNPTYYSSIILNDESFRKRIIKTGSAFHEKLTGREIDCLYWAAYGKSSEETANILKLSKLTIDGYRSSVKRKLNAANMAQAVFEAVRHGYLGAFDKAWKISDPISLNGISISESENKASTEEKIKNSLWLLNTELLSTHQH